MPARCLSSPEFWLHCFVASCLLFGTRGIIVLQHSTHSREEISCDVAQNVTGAEEIAIPYLIPDGAQYSDCQCLWELHSPSLQFAGRQYSIAVSRDDVVLDLVASADWFMPHQAFAFVFVPSESNGSSVAFLFGNGASRPMENKGAGFFLREKPHILDKDNFVLTCKPTTWLASRMDGKFRAYESPVADGDERVLSPGRQDGAPGRYHGEAKLVVALCGVIAFIALVAYILHKVVRNRTIRNHEIALKYAAVHPEEQQHV